MAGAVQTEPTRFFALRAGSAWERGSGRGIEIGDLGLSLRGVLDFGKRKTLEHRALRQCSGSVAMAPGCCHLLYFFDLKTARLLGYDLNRERPDEPLSLDGVYERPLGFSMDGGLLYVLDGGEHWTLYGFSPQRGEIERVVPLGAGGVPPRPDCLAVDGTGHCWIPGTKGDSLLRIGPDGTVLEFGHPHLRGHRILSMAAGPGPRVHLLYGNGVKEKSMSFSSEGESEGMALDFSLALPGVRPVGLAADAQGRLYFAAAETASGRFLGRTSIFQWRPGRKSLREIARVRGRVDRLAIDKAQRLVAADTRTGKLHLFYLEPQYRTGWYLSPIFDSRDPSTRWHKAVLDLETPPLTEVRFSYAVSGDSEDLAAASAVWSPPLVNPPSALIRAEPGRYLRFRIELKGHLDRGPLVKGLTVSFPRTSYLRYLPAIYHAEHDHFSERFLALFESFFEQCRDRIDRIPALFDPDAAQGDLLRWLGGWLGLVHNERWPDHELRIILKFAPIWYRTRGTRYGLELLVRTFIRHSGPAGASVETEPMIGAPVFVEKVGLADSEGADTVHLDRLFGDGNHWFSILLDPSHIQTELDLEILKYLVETGKPVHTLARLEVLRRRIVLGDHLFLGINTFLQPAIPRLGIDSVMGGIPAYEAHPPHTD